MDANTSEMKEITAVARSMVFMSNSSSQKRFTPKTSILAFLRRDVLEAETKLLEDKGISIFDTAATLSQAKRAFYTKRGTAVAHKPFKEFKTKMQSLFNNGEIGMTLGTQHDRMLLEDIMGLSVGTEIVYLIHQSHIFVAGEKPTWWSRRIHSIAKDKKSRCHFVKFQKNLYWAVKATVCNNPEKHNLHEKTYTEDDISKGCTQKGGWGITVELSTGYKKNLLFTDFIQHPIQLQIWMNGTTTNYERIRAKLSDLSNNASRAAMTKRLFDEAYGDPILTQDIAFKYSTTIKKRESNTREDLISKANKKCKDAIESTYGEFNSIPSPLLSFTEVSISSRFSY